MRTVSHLLLGLALTASLPAHGLGFGELSVSSALGQPFDGRILLLDAPADISPDCFQLRPAENDALQLPPGIRLEIERLPGRRAALKLTSRQPINDPVLGFVATAICEVQLGREYTLLLDPVPISEPFVEAPAAAAPVTPETPVQNTPREALPKQIRPRKIPPAPIADAVHTQTAPPAYQGGKRKNAARVDRLVISQGRAFPIAGAGTSLEQAIGSMTLNELADENAALNLRLSHLEQQLNALQKRHAEIVARSELAAAAKQKATPSYTWAYILPGFLLLIIAAAWLLHRRDSRTPGLPDETEIDIQHVRRASAPLPSADPGMERLPPAEEMPQKQVDAEFPEHAPRNPVIRDELEDNVEVFVAHGQNALAIRLLEDHIRHDPKGSLAPWLLWLDLLHRAENPVKYEEVRQQCRRHFNTIVPTYETCKDHAMASGIESYRHVMAELVRLWPTEKIAAYLDDLLYDNRRGNRIGFDPGAYQEIMLLREICTAA